MTRTMIDAISATATVRFQHGSIVRIVTGGRGIRVVRTAGDSTGPPTQFFEGYFRSNEYRRGGSWIGWKREGWVVVLQGCSLRVLGSE